MRLTCSKVLLTWAVLAVVFGDASSIVHFHDPNCDCEDCNETNVIGLEEDEDATTTTVAPIIEEDADGDGNRTICARDRDQGDRTFVTLCHMHCVNRCTRYQLDLAGKSKIARAYRPSYYKLKDGPCEAD